MRNTLIILVGPTCSGKTHWALDMVASHHFIRVAEDEILNTLIGNKVNKKVSQAAAIAVDGILAFMANDSKDIILDSNYLSLERIDGIINSWDRHYDIEYKIFSESIELINRRMQLRQKNYQLTQEALEKQIRLTKTLETALVGYRGIQTWVKPAWLNADMYEEEDLFHRGYGIY